MATSADDRKFLSEFIEIYRENPCLWKVKDEHYSDRAMKDAAYELLVEKMKERDPYANKETVTKKINNIRSTFRKECKKVAVSIQSGAGPRDVYKPHLWYYDELLFLKDQEPPRRSLSSMDEILMIDVDNLPSSDESSQETPARVSSAPRVSHTPTTTSIPSARKKARPPPMSAADNVLAIIGERLAAGQDEDEYDAVGKNVASKLRKMSPDMQVIAEKLISDVLYDGQIGALTLQSKVITPRNGTGNHLTMGGYHVNYPDICNSMDK